MDLQTAAKRYEEGRRFWAREIALKLARGYSGSLVVLLRTLQVHDRPMHTNCLLAALPSPYRNMHSRETTGSNHLRQLFKGGLVTRTRKQHSYWYTLTELGALVLAYSPELHDIREEKNIPELHDIRERKKRGRSRKRPLLEVQGI